jgi:A/G-specific adenine glycosylase
VFSDVRGELLDWYDRERRELPWRKTRDPYAVWVSEIMLQQTRVATVVPYYARFMERFPDPASLASASEDEVLAHWSGLGYYRRARLLQRGVREVVERYGGRVPEDPALRRALPGIGAYTSGAIGSIAFSREEAIVDGNVARVLSRVFAIEEPLGGSASERMLWSKARELVEGTRPGDFNQALMELGARICTPREPRCAECPIASACIAKRDGRTSELPTAKKRTRPKRIRQVAVVATRGERVALVRSTDDLFGGLHLPPIADGRGREAARAALRAAGVSARLDRAIGTLKHVLSHRVLDMEVWRATGARGTLVSRSELADIGIATLTRRILDLATAGLAPRRRES